MTPTAALAERWHLGAPSAKIAGVTNDRETGHVEPDLGAPSSRQETDAESIDSAVRRVFHELAAVDLAVYRAIANSSTPTIDVPLRKLSNAANRSLLWVGIAGILAFVGGKRGRRAAAAGLVSIGVSSAVVNLGLKRLYSRERPDRAGAGVTDVRHTTMPGSSSFPSGHSASGFAFATAVGREIPVLAFPLRLLAASVAYSRVHSGVHYPGDTLIGSIAGGAIGQAVSHQFSWRTPTS